MSEAVFVSYMLHIFSEACSI